MGGPHRLFLPPAIVWNTRVWCYQMNVVVVDMKRYVTVLAAAARVSVRAAGSEGTIRPVPPSF